MSVMGTVLAPSSQGQAKQLEQTHCYERVGLLYFETKLNKGVEYDYREAWFGAAKWIERQLKIV